MHSNGHAPEIPVTHTTWKLDVDDDEQTTNVLTTDGRYVLAAPSARVATYLIELHAVAMLLRTVLRLR